MLVLFLRKYWQKESMPNRYLLWPNIGTIGVTFVILILGSFLSNTTVLQTSSWSLVASIVTLWTIAFSAFLEEGSKHIITAGTLPDKPIGQQDLILVSIFCALGFVWIENIVYLFTSWNEHSWNDFAVQWSLRSIFSLATHIFSVSICAYFWSRALSYRVWVSRYILVFCGGFILAIVSHSIYNFALSH
jgi:RsiW-degrading membrane proteinase PrsW (M82 family)